MHFLSAVLFAVSSNMDNLVLGLSYGIQKKRIGWRANLLVALISLAGTALSMLLGGGLLLFLPPRWAA
jgi:putative Mn2+ efflux pump MntP